MAQTLAAKRLGKQLNIGGTSASHHGKVGVSGSSPLGSFRISTGTLRFLR
ncbi:hypothetical protein [Bacillus sp. JCM 19041]